MSDMRCARHVACLCPWRGCRRRCAGPGGWSAGGGTSRTRRRHWTAWPSSHPGLPPERPAGFALAALKAAPATPAGAEGWIGGESLECGCVVVVEAFCCLVLPTPHSMDTVRLELNNAIPEYSSRWSVSAWYILTDVQFEWAGHAFFYFANMWKELNFCRRLVKKKGLKILFSGHLNSFIWIINDAKLHNLTLGWKTLLACINYWHRGVWDKLSECSFIHKGWIKGWDRDGCDK